jgi:hypothetical protein
LIERLPSVGNFQNQIKIDFVSAINSMPGEYPNRVKNGYGDHSTMHVRCTRDRSYAGATDGGYHLGLYLPTSLGDTLMEARTMSLPPAASHDDAERRVLAIELSKKSWIVAVNTPLSDKISRYTLKPCDWKELLKLSERIRTRVAGEETRGCGFLLRSRLMTAFGSTVCSKRGAYANTSPIRQMCWFIVGRAEPRRTELMSSDCSGR